VVSNHSEDFGVKSHSVISAEEVAKKHGIPRDEFINYLTAETDAADSCQSLPFTLLLVISYALMVMSHDDAPLVNAVEDSIGFDITENANFAFSSEFMGHKNIEDVNNHADFWSWLTRGLVPLVFTQEYQLAEGRNWSEPYTRQASERFGRKDRGVLLNYNRIVLGVRMSQERFDEPWSCEDKRMLAMFDGDCVGGYAYNLEPELFLARRTSNPKRWHWLYINDEVELIKRQLVQMEKDRWLDTKTQKVELALPIYNAEYGLHTLIMCDFFFSRGGRIWKNIIPLSAYAVWFPKWNNYLYDFVWLCCLMWIIVTEAVEIFKVLREFGFNGLWTEYAGFWNMIDWISVISGVSILIMFYRNMIFTAAMNASLEELGRIDEATQRDLYRAKGQEYVMALETEVHSFYYFKLFLSFYPLVIALRLFKAYTSFPRLAVVTRTLNAASVDLAHFSIIIFSVFITYTVASIILFGRDDASFAIPSRAINTCFRIMFGDFDWDSLREVGRLDAFMWLVPFILLVVMLLLNMVIAIVMDAYADVVANLGTMDTLLDIARKAYQQKLRHMRGETVPLTMILNALKNEEAKASLPIRQSFEAFDLERENPESLNALMATDKQSALDNQLTIITVSSLKRLFSKVLHSRQAVELIQNAVMSYYNQHRESADLDEALHLMFKIDDAAERFKHVSNNRCPQAFVARNCMSWCAKLAEARGELAAWLPEDSGDMRLPLPLLHRARASAPRPPTPSVQVIWKVLCDEQAVLVACRAAGISPQHDDRRRAAIGRRVQVLEHNERDAIVRCRLRSGLEFQLPVAAFVPPRLKHEFSTEGSMTTSERSEGARTALESRLQDLEHELRVGRKTVADAVSVVNRLRTNLLQRRADNDRSVEKFRLLRRKAVLLKEENDAQCVRYEQGKVRLKRLTSERDEYYELAKSLAEENQQLQATASAA